MTVLAVAAAAWVLLHVLVAGTFRPAIAGRAGEHAFRGIFSVLSVLSLGFLIWAYRGTPYQPLWDFGVGALHLAKLLVFIACFLLVGSLTPRNPNLAGADFVLKDQLPAEGLIHVSTLADDFYQYDRAAHALAGRRAGNQFRLGDRVRVQVVHVDLERRELDFKLVGKLKSAARPPAKERSRPSKRLKKSRTKPAARKQSRTSARKKRKRS